MTNPAFAPRSSPSAAIDSAIDRYLTTTCARLDRVVAGAALAEPTVRDPDRAAKLLDRLLETLAGRASGDVIGAVVAGVRRTFGAPVQARVETAVAHAIGGLAPPERPPLYALDASPARAFGGELQQRLRRRLAAAPRALAAVFVAIGRTIDPVDAPAFVRMIGILADDVLVATRFCEQLHAGWRCFVAANEHRRIDITEPAWAQWMARVTGHRPVTVLTPAQIVAAGFINRIG